MDRKEPIRVTLIIPTSLGPKLEELRVLMGESTIQATIKRALEHYIDQESTLSPPTPVGATTETRT